MKKRIDDALKDSNINDLLSYDIEGTEKDLFVVIASPIGRTMSFQIEDPYISVDDFFNFLSEKYNIGKPDEIRGHISKLV